MRSIVTCTGINGREEILFLDRDYPMVDNQNQSLKFSEPYQDIPKTYEVTKLFFPRLIDRCRIKERHCPISQLDNLC